MLIVIFMVILGIVALVSVGIGVVAKSLGAWLTALGSVILAVILLFMSSFYTQGVGDARVIVNFDGTVAGYSAEPGSGWKAPWQDFNDWDLFAQEVSYAGQPGNAPEYTGGSVQGAEVTTYVQGVGAEDGQRGSTQANMDISIVYSINGDAIVDLYKTYRSQQRFTQQVVEKTILNVIRAVPSSYTAVDFRGSKKTEAQEQMLIELNEALNPLGVEVDFVNIQDIRFTPAVEEALSTVEVENQKVAAEEARLRAAEVAAQQKIVTATAEAEANRILAESLTPTILQQRYIEALREAGAVYVVPQGSQPLVTIK